MSFDPNVPLFLKEVQQWFAAVITGPIDEESRMNPISPSGIPMEQDAWNYIIPSQTMKPDQRIQIYNQQYWWRLLSTLQENFPLVTRLFGYHDFNCTIAIPYLMKYPPNHWSLNFLGDRILQWIMEEYQASDKQLIYDAARIDWAYNHSFVAPVQTPLVLEQGADFESLLSKPVALQKHVYLFDLPYDLFRFRVEFLKQDPEYWIENDFPALTDLSESQTNCFVLYRNSKNDISVVQIEKNEHRVLNRFNELTCIDSVCQWLESQEEAFCSDVSSKLQDWFQRWAALQWLAVGSGMER